MNNDPMIRSGGKVPFSWENRPGVSKMNSTNHVREPASSKPRLPPPPCPPECERKPKLQVMQIPLPPCTFQPLPPPPRPRSTSNSKKGEKKREEDDPFFAAYKECTKGNNSTRKHDWVGGGGLRKHLLGLSCKKSACGVRN